ncbi:coiled-coil domain-containing protein 137 [Vanessa cardui]|uniref:coiled-coil domain-containing protein 137 n=1 Tax=Vanessa cardui TaxID=171605 RepID=UPI001F13074A|nr:coiled-coil domain-containing protein 137 [Vanessa cardui]
MGRKIPAKKHRGVKDPLVQQARRLQSLKGKINAPPKDPDEQPIPKSVTQLFAFQNKEHNKKKKSKKITLKDDGRVSKAGKNPIARLKKLPGESGRDFSLRINSTMRALHDPMEQLDYPQDVEAEDMKGERMAALRERRQRKHKAAMKKDPSLKEEPKLTRTQKLTLKKQAKKLKIAEETARPDVQYERVQFGELAHAPPALSAPRRAPPPDRAGRRDLLLTSMLAGAGGTGGAGGAAGAAELARRERMRVDVVAAYRELKKQRRLEDAAGRKARRPARPAPT